MSDTEDYWASDSPTESDCPTRPDWLIDIDNLSELDILAPHEKVAIQSQASILVDCSRTSLYGDADKAATTINNILQHVQGLGYVLGKRDAKGNSDIMSHQPNN